MLVELSVTTNKRQVPWREIINTSFIFRIWAEFDTPVLEYHDHGKTIRYYVHTKYATLLDGLGVKEIN
jgi:hypothetical protein